MIYFENIFYAIIRYAQSTTICQFIDVINQKTI